jgi:archaellum biogenesis ATPase FlaH
VSIYKFNTSDAWDFARQQGIEVKQSGDQLHFKTCPYCKPRATRDNTRTFSINLRTGQFKCLRESCGVTGNMITLSRDFDFSLGNDVDEYYQSKKQFKKIPTPKEPIIPKEPAVAYLESRGISEEIAKRYEITTQTDHKNILVFPFYDEEGKLQFVKYRKTDFNKEKDNNKEWCEANCKPILFGMKQCNLENKRLVLTEGQLDSLSVSESGIENAVSVPNGAKGFTWVPYCYDWMKQFDEIIIFGDFEKGRISLLEEMKTRFPNKIRHVRPEDYKGCKDANEILLKHGKEAVKQAVENAAQVRVKNIIPLAEVEDVNIYKLEKLRTGISELDQNLYGGLPFGTVCIIAGKRGDGKSTLGSQIMGWAIDQGYAIFVYSGELPNYLYKSWFDFQLAGSHHITENVKDGFVNRFITTGNQKLINGWYSDKAYIYDSKIIESDEQEDLLKTIEESIRRYEVKVILLDNLMTAMYLDENKGSDKYDQQGRFVRQLTRIALRYNVLILLVAHRRKNSFTTDANDEISGSGDITNLASVTLSYDRMSKEELNSGIASESQRKLIVAKNRLFGKINLKGIILEYDEKSKRIYEKSKGCHWKLGWDKEWQQINTDNPFD